jgi:hypothetical protein
MDLETARGLKQELLSFIDRTSIPRRGGRGEAKPTLAMGFAPTHPRGDVHIAVRAETRAELPRSVADELRRRTKKQIDIRYIGEITPLLGPYIALPTTRPLAVGASIAHCRCGPGTLGFFARRSSDGAIGIVSNNHVIAATDEGEDRDKVLLQRVPGDNGTRTHDDIVAYLSGKYPRLRGGSATLDCAFATLARGMQDLRAGHCVRAG